MPRMKKETEIADFDNAVVESQAGAQNLASDFGTNAETGAVQGFINQMTSEASQMHGNITGYGKTKVLDRSKKYHVMSVTYGGLTFKSEKTGTPIRWRELGDTKELSAEEIEEMNSYNSDYLEKPYVILLENDAIEYFRLEELYSKMAKVNDLKTLFKSNIETVAAAIDEAIENDLQDFLISKVRTMYENKTLTDINIIKLLKDKLRFEFANI